MWPIRGEIFALSLLAVVLTASMPVAAQVDVHVDDDCDGAGDGSPGDPYCTIQEAICFLKDEPGGGTANVSPGSYNEAIRFFPGVSVVSTDGPSVTTIDATGAYCYLSSCTPSGVTPCAVAYFPTGSSTNSERLEGFRLTGGGGLNQTCSGGCDLQAGAGIFILRSSPTITNNEIVNNTLTGDPKVYYGAGIYVQSSLGTAPATPVITNNLVEGNVNNSPPGQNQNNPAFSLGGGIYVGFHAAPVIDSNTIRLNTAGDFDTSNQIAGGGGIGIYTALDAGAVPVISRNVVSTNSTTGRGGGISAWYGEVSLAPSVGQIENNLVEYNDAADGGGIAGRWSTATVRNNTIVNNLAETGGGISIYDTGDPLDQVTLVNNIVSLNTANVADGGGGMFVMYADPVVNNNDFQGDVPDEIDGDFDDVDYIDLDGNFSADPLFTSTMPGSRDLRLQTASPAIEAGDNAGAPSMDLDSVPRVQDGDFDEVAVVDLGAYEFSPDFDGDAAPDWQDDDDDDDGVPDAADCRDFSSSVSSLPGNVPSLEVREIGAGTRVRWDRGFQGHTSNLYRGSIGAFFSDTCLLEEQPGRSTVDTDVPAASNGFYYLVSAKNVCGESDGAEGVPPPAPCGTIGLDTDTDGLIDVLDNCAAVANDTQDDADGDWVGDLCDNCPALSNVDQADGDEDGAGNFCDCAPANGAITETMPDVDGLAVDFRFPTTLTWIDQGSGVHYDVASGLLSALSVDSGISGAGCPGSDVTVATWDDPRADPPVNDGYYYAVRTQSGSCDGLFGNDSSAPRETPGACF